MVSGDTSPGNERAFSFLAGRRCSFCGEGRLVRGTYEGDVAVVCSTCETPAFRSW